MKFNMFKKDKSKENKKANTGEDETVEITDLEEQLNNETNNLMEKQKQLESLSGDGTEEETAVPHGPIEELQVEPSNTTSELQTEPAAGAEAPPDETGEEIKVVEVIADAVPNNPEINQEEAPPPQEEKKDDSLGSSFNQLFQSEEEEENPLANLIKGLPDVSAEELVKDLNEIRDIIKEWQKKT